ncbi:ribokinase-like domain-containing protein [Mycolicibacterium aurum]|uniref:Ribokinase-like domain-containing protein n=2 Tax=Mycolicibacterium aurum TaxID=1791 RepID=A0A3S5EJP7_MYCAU|nr:ribokinase-like domain-containing protein [Mycolicibacterium aurum]
MNQPAIVTLTMNPALDVAADADEVRPTEKIRCRAERYDPGGGGINVARFAHALGASVAAVFTAGGPTGARVVDLVGAAGVPHTAVAITGATRESFTVNERATGQHYRFVLPGPTLTRDEQDRCLDALEERASSARFVVMSGSLPPGVQPDFPAEVAALCERTGASLILDTSGKGLSNSTSNVFLCKPSLRELSECVGRALATEADQLAAARELIDRGVARVVVVSRGAMGVLLATARDSRSFSAVTVPVVSEVGTGDAMVAGIVVGLSRALSIEDSVRYGIAAATAKLSTPGTAAFERDDVESLFGTYSISRR